MILVLAHVGQNIGENCVIFVSVHVEQNRAILVLVHVGKNETILLSALMWKIGSF